LFGKYRSMKIPDKSQTVLIIAKLSNIFFYPDESGQSYPLC